MLEPRACFPPPTWDPCEDLKAEDAGAADAEGDPETAEETRVLGRVGAVGLDVGHGAVDGRVCCLERKVAVLGLSIRDSGQRNPLL